ncbi:hypothetical protein HYT04_01535 [Candidatus Kaiserbacteria bacterium]|nr:hypothetical protein [Candidatus Kaiserbacteria bacterium]
MRNALTNLLPPERQRLLSRDYALRVGTVVAVLATALVFSAAALLIPTYVYLGGSENTKKADLARIRSVLSSADEAELSARLSVLSANAAELMALSSASSASSVIRETLSIPRPGIALSGFSLTVPMNNESRTLVVTGSSATRDALRGYQLALQGAPFIRSAVLPVSAYAKDSNIPFAITITLAP